MRVTESRNPRAYQPKKEAAASHGQQRPQGKGKDFADAFVRTAAQRHGKHEHEKNDNQSKYPDIAKLNLRRPSIHNFGGTQFKPTPEQLVPAKEDEEPVFGTLQYYDGSNDAEAIKFIPDPPTYPGSILAMSTSELQTALNAVSFAVYGIQMEGVPKQEVYDQIKEIYNSYLGEDFLEIAHQKSRDHTDNNANLYNRIYGQFFSELQSHRVHNLTSTEVRELKEYNVDALDKLTEKLLSERVSPSNPRSIYDMQNTDRVAALRTVSLQARTGGNIGDAEGLSREDIFERLEAVYASYFGKDFLNGGVETRGQGGIYDNIYLQFFDELKQYNVHSTSTDAILSLRSYSVQALDDTWLTH